MWSTWNRNWKCYEAELTAANRRIAELEGRETELEVKLICKHQEWASCEAKRRELKKRLGRMAKALTEANIVLKAHAAGNFFSVEAMELIGCLDCDGMSQRDAIKDWSRQIHTKDCPTKVARDLLEEDTDADK